MICDCRGHKEYISINDCICSPDDASDLETCKRIEELPECMGCIEPDYQKIHELRTRQHPE